MEVSGDALIQSTILALPRGMTEENYESLSKDSRLPDRVSNQRTPEYKSERYRLCSAILELNFKQYFNEFQV